MSAESDLIDGIIANAIAVADTNTTKASDAADALIASSAGAWYDTPSSDAGFDVSAIEPEIPDIADSKVEYETRLADIIALLRDQFADFFSTYYPLASDAFDEATAWLIDVITNGGTGVNTTVEDQIWQRDRERRTAEGRKTKAQLVTGYAAKGFFLPAGSLLKKIEEIDYAVFAENGVASTAVAAKQLEIEIETVRFAIGGALKSRSMAMQAAADYLKAISLTPESAVRVAELNSDARAKMLSASAQWYSTRLDRDKIILSSKLAEMASTDDIYKQRQNASIQGDQVDVTALGHAADVLGSTAQAALLSINSIVGTTASTFV